MNRETEEKEVFPAKGLGSILFGMKVTDVERILARAVEASVFDGGNEWTLSLRYPGLTLFFDQSEDFRLTAIEAEEESGAYLFGEPLFPRSVDQIMNLLKSNLTSEEFDEVEETSNEALGEKVLNLSRLAITFYFDLHGNLEEVNWGVLVGSEDQVKWPHPRSLQEGSADRA